VAQYYFPDSVGVGASLLANIGTIFKSIPEKFREQARSYKLKTRFPTFCDDPKKSPAGSRAVTGSAFLLLRIVIVLVQ
jgi:hypothetical protein